MGSNNDDPAARTAAWKGTNYIRQFRAFDCLFGKMLIVTTSFSKHLFECYLSLVILAGIFAQSRFNNILSDWLEPNILSEQLSTALQCYNEDSGGITLWADA